MVRVETLAAPEINRREILRYAGCREADGDVRDLMEECIRLSQDALTYQICWAEYDLPQQFASRDLAKNLSGCRRAIVFGGTVGLGLDRLIARYGRISPARALMLQAIGAERIESLCDAFQACLRANGYRMRPRFSPGYGDLPLAAQRDIFDALQCAKHIGLSLNDSLLMSPSKSVTAIIGLTEGEDCAPAGCEQCAKADCQFRRN